MTILELETSNSCEVIKDIFESLSVDASASETDRATFNRLNTEYGQVFDDTLASLYGERELRPFATATFHNVPFWSVNIGAYLRRRATYLGKCLLYIDAEYNPVENYMGNETESITENRGARSENTSNTIGSQSNSKTTGAQSNSTSYGAISETTSNTQGAQSNSYTHGAHDDQVIEDVRTERNKNAPFESNDFFNNTETTTGGEQNNAGVIQPHTTESKFAQQSDSESIGSRSDNGTRGVAAHSDSENIGSRSDSETIGGRSDSGTHTAAAYTDTISRTFARHGNIGVLSAGELMQRDSDFFKSFQWIFDTVHDIANLISGGVYAL